ncbi:hypothetical protein [Alteromonas flava]|uniref:hypothetical protein n=1 Tax=Alteromonas flava TaxID=2048003 RepID=UPI000C28E065|nr:hypothetical protein [Alteromonas flava]
MASNFSATILLHLISTLLLSVVNVSFSFASDLNANTQFESDNVFLTTRVNKSQEQFSTSVDSVQLLFDILGYETPVNHVPMQRSLKKLDEGATICVVNRIKTNERTDTYAYSLALNFFHTQRLYQHAELPALSPDLLNDSGEVVSLNRVFESYPEALIVTAKGFSFGENIDRQLRKISHTQKIQLASDTYYQRAIQLLTKGRIQFGLFFPASMYLQFGERVPVATRQYMIADNPRFTTGHFICADNATGRKTIQILNSGIRNLYGEPEFLALHTRYLPSKSHAEIEAIIQRYIERLNTEKPKL